MSTVAHGTRVGQPAGVASSLRDGGALDLRMRVSGMDQTGEIIGLSLRFLDGLAGKQASGRSTHCLLYTSPSPRD